MKTPVRLFLALLIGFALSGCGYHLGEIRPTPMRSVRTLAVPTFKNKTFEPRVEVILADTLIKTLQEDGTYTIVQGSRADATLEGVLTKIDRRSIRSVQNNVLATSEFELRLDIQYTVYSQLTGATLLQGRVIGKTTFFANEDLQTTERQAIPLAARDAAIQITTEIAEGW